ncbi:PTS IIA-like nitrogen regulatory protein PtsN [Caulobacter mirabilis]|uniref:PTS IIA-like nitrogen-regulatory protein PtsN n=1 Tax=Caulobacter mirabilis TaxID=69666 RepID=A0A2D2B3G7_9CAUL|nr:PTS IIA-like nitrogen regulatory protein PtsN [Caulobacter mirabilis]ATQ44781.1 PTS IIA-like nitrogen-regulatory protein PtsN [Caulobacter mirabilis]
MNIGDLLEPRAIAPRAGGGSKRQVLSAVADIAARNLRIRSEDVLDALLEREAAGSTGVGHGVAIPHARIPGLTAVRGVFMRLETPTPFESLDDQPVDLIFALFAPAESRTEHLQALARVSRLMRQGDLRQQLRQARTAEAIHALLAREAQPSAA